MSLRVLATFGVENPRSLKVLLAAEKRGFSVMKLDSAEDQEPGFEGAEIYALYDWHRGNLYTISSVKTATTPQWARDIGAVKCLRIAPRCDHDDNAETCAKHIINFLSPKKREAVVACITPSARLLLPTGTGRPYFA